MWTALTKPERLRRWLAEAEFEERVGGRVELRFDDGVIEGTVRELDRPRLLEYEWVDNGARSVVRFELGPAGGGTLLVLDHRQLPADAAAGFGAGWHSHLDSLAETLAAPERPHDPDAWWSRFQALLPRYGEAVAGAQASDRRTV